MIARKCPKCGSRWYSADTRKWTCNNCGEKLTDKNNVDLKEEE